jgi:nucleoside-diphosphate-sugar epimerase
MDSSLNSLKIEYIQIRDIDSLDINLKKYLDGCDCIVHCAGKAHKMNDTDNLDAYQSANIMGTQNLAEQADLADLKTPSFIHSIRFVDYPTTISRRLLSFLGCSKIKNTFGIDPSN